MDKEFNKIPVRDARDRNLPKFKEGGKTPAWTRKAGKNPSGGLNKKGVASYRAANPGSKLKTAVTTKPSKLKKGSKAAKRRKSYCARSLGQLKEVQLKLETTLIQELDRLVEGGSVNIG